MAALDGAKLAKHVDDEWDTSIIPTLCEYIKVPCQSPHYDAEWATNGLLDKALDILVAWAEAHPIEGMKMTRTCAPGKTPFLFITVPAFRRPDDGKTVLLYAHMDKQPPLLPWAEGLGPYEPVIRDGKLYGRGGADDGYGMCAAITSLRALQEQGIPHGRCVIAVEASEESGSPDLPHYIEAHKADIGDVDFVVCLDSGAHSYDTMWLTTSLRGVVSGTLKVSTLTEGMHSGVAGGLVPSSFRVARRLLDRIEDPDTGDIKVAAAHLAEMPSDVWDSMPAIAALPPHTLVGPLPFQPGTRPAPGGNAEHQLANAWRPCLEVVGADGLPPCAKAGNVLRPETALRLSVRVPPLVDAEAVMAAIGAELTRDPPHGAKVEWIPGGAAAGWAAPPLAPWLKAALAEASGAVFGKGCGLMGLGGTIPFMGMLGRQFPAAQFCVTGVLGPKSNAHGPNEFLHIAFGKGITQAVARIIAAHSARAH